MVSNPDALGSAGSPAAKRMRLYRLRKRCGLRCLTIELPDKIIAALIQRGLLTPQARDDPAAVTHALYVHLARTLE